MPENDNLLQAFGQLVQMNGDFLKMQKEFIVEISNLSKKIEQMEIKDSELRKEVTTALSNTFDIVNRMKAASNESILEQLQKNNENWIKLNENIKTVCGGIDSVKDSHEDSETFKAKLDVFTEKLTHIGDSFNVIKKVLWGIGVVLLIIQILFSIFGVKNSDQVKKMVQEELKIMQNKR